MHSLDPYFNPQKNQGEIYKSSLHQSLHPAHPQKNSGTKQLQEINDAKTLEIDLQPTGESTGTLRYPGNLVLEGGRKFSIQAPGAIYGRWCPFFSPIKIEMRCEKCDFFLITAGPKGQARVGFFFAKKYVYIQILPIKTLHLFTASKQNHTDRTKPPFHLSTWSSHV